METRKHSLGTVVNSVRVRIRAFTIWQKLGYLPWHKAKEKRRRKGGDFYKGAFDAIPFLNDDAKRTFSHLLLRPGYMMRDYIRGDHERYLAPFTALIIFYAFFALISAVLEPVQQHRELPGDRLKERFGLDISQEPSDSIMVNGESDRILTNVVKLVRTGYLYLHLDQYPEVVDTQHESSIAALENTLRSQGIPLFLGKFFLLWMALSVALRKYKLGLSACAAISAYILCQFSFFMLFAVLLTWGESTSLGISLMAVLLTFDFCQLLGIDVKKSLRRVLSVGFHYVLWYFLLLVLVSLLVVGIAYFKR